MSGLFRRLCFAFLSMSRPLPKLKRCHSLSALEKSREIVLIRNAAGCRDFPDRLAGFGKKLLRIIQPLLAQATDKGFPVSFLKTAER